MIKRPGRSEQPQGEPIFYYIINANDVNYLLMHYYFNLLAPQLFSSSACRFCSQGVTAVVHGLQFKHWATIRVESSKIVTGSPLEELRAKATHQTSDLNHLLYYF